MKIEILVHDYGGYPFIFDLSRGLAAHGYSVLHVYSSASGSPGAEFEESENLAVLDLGKDLSPVNKHSFVQRFKQENEYGRLIEQKIAEVVPRIIISGNTPLEAQKRIARKCQKEGIYLIHWLQDLLSVAATSVLKKKNRLLAECVGRYFSFIEKMCLRKADHVVAISDDFSKKIQTWGVAIDKISVIENWSSIAELPLVKKENSFSLKYGIDDTFNLIYSGTLGMKQNPNALIEIAKMLRGKSNARLVVVATGSGVPYIEEAARKHNLDNLLILPLQPFSELPNVLGSGDLLIAVLESDASVYCVPSKVLTYYCAGKPVLLILSKNNLVSRKTIENDLGFVVEPDDAYGLNDVIGRALENPALLSSYGMRARAYAEEHFQVEKIVQRFLPVIRRALP
jgi:colanic acid biosynthesis glycosyl transferase WcaI